MEEELDAPPQLDNPIITEQIRAQKIIQELVWKKHPLFMIEWGDT